MEEMKRLISEYCMAEFGYDASFDDLHHVGLAYTTHEITCFDQQAEADLVKHELLYYYGNKLVHIESAGSEETFCMMLRDLNWDDLISKCYSKKVDKEMGIV